MFEIVLAMQINPITYPYYLKLPAETHWEEDVMNGAYVLLRPERELGWAWMDKDEFESTYTAIETELFGQFNRYIEK